VIVIIIMYFLHFLMKHMYPQIGCHLLENGTYRKCDESKNVQHHKHLTNVFFMHSHFVAFNFNWECTLIHIAEDFMILFWQHTMHTLSYVC
jgi:hypothetical protein